MKKIFASAAIILGLLQAPVAFAGIANTYPTGPKEVKTGQLFQVIFVVDSAKDVDTVRLNGTYTQDVLEYRATVPSGVFNNISPGVFVNQQSGNFSFGTFTLSAKANGQSKLATMTFKAKKPGHATIQLGPTSKILSDGEEQIGSVGKIDINITGQNAPIEQPHKNPPGLAGIYLFSPTHPDPNTWYPNRKTTVTWDAGKAVKTYYFGLDQSPEGPADKEIKATSTQVNLPKDGSWYAHLKVIYIDKTTDQADLQILVDTVSPHPLAPSVDQSTVAANFPNAVRFAALDDTSGISQYDIAIDGMWVASTTAHFYPIMGQKVGHHVIEISAIDRAGNLTSGKTDFDITPASSLISKTITTFHLFSWWILLLLALILFILLVSFWMVTKDQKKKKSTGHR